MESTGAILERRTVKLEFSEQAHFLREYRSNLSKGGIFVRVDEPFKLREPVDVEVVLGFQNASVVISGEVVGVVSKELSASGESGVAVQLHETAEELDLRFQKYLPAAPAHAEKKATGKSAAIAPSVPARIVPRADLPVEADQQRAGKGAVLGKAIELKKVHRVVMREIVQSPPQVAAPPSVEQPKSVSEAPTSGEDSFSFGKFSIDDLPPEDVLPEVAMGAVADAASPSAAQSQNCVTPTTAPSLEATVCAVKNSPDAESSRVHAAESCDAESEANSETIERETAAEEEERRVAPRAPVHLTGQIESASGAKTILSQNISHSGVLVAVEGETIPIGEPVHLVLSHPVTGDELELEGSVARHQETDGSVVAVAVRFEVPEARRKAVASFIDDVKAAEHAQSLAGIHGLIAEMGAPKVLQMFAMTVPEGTLRFKRDEEEGSIVFRAGMLRWASVGTVSGRKALWRLMSWDTGQFEFRAQAIETAEADEAPVMLHDAILQGVAQITELKHLDLAEFPTAAKLSLKKKFPKNLNSVEAAVVDLARSNFTVRRVLDVIPASDLEIYRALAQLRQRDVIHFSEAS